MQNKVYIILHLHIYTTIDFVVNDGRISVCLKSVPLKENHSEIQAIVE